MADKLLDRPGDVVKTASKMGAVQAFIKEYLEYITHDNFSEHWFRCRGARFFDAKGRTDIDLVEHVYPMHLNNDDPDRQVDNPGGIGGQTSGMSLPIFKRLNNGEPDQKGGDGGNGGPSYGMSLPILKHVKKIEQAIMNFSINSLRDEAYF